MCVCVVRSHEPHSVFMGLTRTTREAAPSERSLFAFAPGHSDIF